MRHALPVILVLAFAIRVAGTWTDLPYVYHWDEPTPVNVAVWLHEERSLDPQFFHYPGGLIYLLAGEFGLVRGLGQLVGRFPDAEASLAWLSQGTPPRPPGGGIAYVFPTVGVPLLYLIGRIGNVLLGMFTVFWAFRLAGMASDRSEQGSASSASRGGAKLSEARVHPGKGSRGSPFGSGAFSIALTTAFLLALSPVHARNSALLTTDAPCAAFLTWFLAELVAFRSPLRAGVALGLAAAFKYTGGIGLYLAPIGFLWIWLFGKRGVTVPTLRAWSRFWMKTAPIAALTFLVLNPFVVLAPGRFLSDFLYETRHMREGTGHFGSDIGSSAGGLPVVAQTLWTGLGALLLLGFLWAWIEIVIEIRGLRAVSRRSEPLTGEADGPIEEAGAEMRRARSGSSRGSRGAGTRSVTPWIWLLAAWGVFYLVQLSTWGTVYDRYLIPVWPVLVLVAAWGGRRGLDRLRGLRPSVFPRSEWQIGALAACLLALPVLPSLVRSVSARMTPDPRTELATWIAREIDPGETIAVETSGPQIDATHRGVLHTDLLARRTADEYRGEGARFLISTGRERFLPDASADSMRARQEELVKAGTIVWRNGSYWVLDLGPIKNDWVLVQSNLDAGRFEQAAAESNEMLRRDPSDGKAWHLFGDALVGLGRPDSAAVAYDRAAQLRPDDPTPLYALGNVALGKSDWKSAVAIFERALQRAPEDPVAPLNLSTALMEEARTLVQSGKRDEAESRVASALQYARAAAVLAVGDADIGAQEGRIRRMAEKWGIVVP